MPLYDFKCRECEQVEEDVFMTLKEWKDEMQMFCKGCERVQDHELMIPLPAVDDWGQGRYFEHLSATGETFYDKKSYKKYLKDHNLVEAD